MIIVLCCVGLATGESIPRSARERLPATDSANANCRAAAKRALGSSAEVLKCGHLSGGSLLEVVAAIRLRNIKSGGNGIPVHRLAILRKGKSGWASELSVNSQITNSAGYIGIDFIDDSAKAPGYYVSFSQAKSDKTPAFSIFLSQIAPDGSPEWPVQIAWNPAVQRFQQYARDEEPIGFRSEIKNPPHRNVDKKP